jgi:hypothetical protein
MPNGGGGGAQINSLIDMMQPQAQVAPGAQQQMFGTWQPLSMEPGPPLYSSQAAPAGSVGAGGVSSVFSPPPELAGYFDRWGSPRIDDPRQVAAEGGISLGQLAGGLLPRDRGMGQGYEFPSDKGGFFSIEQLFGLTGTPRQVPGMGGGGPGAQTTQTVREGATPVPQAATFGMGGPSTNNWRLLGRGPGWIMRNGMPIQTQSAGGRWGYPAGGGPSSGASGEQWMLPYPISLGTGAGYGMPNLWATGVAPPYAGWPGAETWFKVGGVPNAGMGGN